MSVEVLVLLDELEEILRMEGYWSDQAPEPSALASSEPFCIDTLSCTQWLQWIYIPRLQAMIAQSLPLPTRVQVQAYVEQALVGLDANRLIDVVGRLDSSMTIQE